MIKWAVVAMALYAFLWGFYGMNPIDSTMAFLNEMDDKLTRGPRLTRCTPSYQEIRDGAPVNESFEELRQEASNTLGVEIPLDAYAVSRSIRSERTPGGPAKEAVVIAWVIRNIAVKSYGGNYILATTGTHGHFGRQLGANPRVSTSADPYKSDLEIALSVVGGLVEDPTGGATNYMHPKGFATTERYREVRAQWEARGLVAVSIPGAPQIEVYRRA